MKKRFAELDATVVGEAQSGVTLVLLHGFGAPGDDLVPLAREIDPEGAHRFVFPEAPLVLPREYAGGRAWWWIDVEARIMRTARGEPHDVNEVPDGLHDASEKVQLALETIARDLQVAPGKLVLGGFSQGAMLALDVALRASVPLAGLVLMSPTHIAAREWEVRYPKREGLPVLMSHGRQDEILSFHVSNGLRQTLTAQKLPTDWVPFDGGHGIPPEMIAKAKAFVARVTQ